MSPPAHAPSTPEPPGPTAGGAALTTLTRPALFVLLWGTAVGGLAKLLRAINILEEGGSLAGFAWLPLGVLAETAFALIPLLVYVFLARALAPSTRAWSLALPLPLAGIAASAAWQAVNLVTLIVTQAGMTWERLRGDEGVTIADAHLIDSFDRLPAYVYGALVLVAAPLLAMLAARLPPVRTSRVIAIAAVATGATVVDAFVLREVNFGVCEQPLFELARTWARAELSSSDRAVSSRAVVPTPTDRAGIDALLASNASAPGPPTRAAPAARNAIIFFAEGVGRKHTALGGADATPRLKERLATGGLELSHHYAPYHKSIAAIFSLACAEYPPPSSKSITEVNPRIDCGELSEVLSAHGVRTGLFHGGDFGFYDKLALLGMRSYDVLRDRSSLQGKGRWMNDWGIDDRAVVDETLAWIDSLPRDERFVAWLIPITAHYPYAYPPDFPARHPGFSGTSRYLSAVAFIDEVFEHLMVGLEQRGLAEDTVVVFTGDHGETIGERPRASPGRRLMYEPSVRVPMVLFNERLFPEPQTNDRLTSHIDVVPTLLDLLGLPPDPRHHGRSVMGADWVERKILLGASNGPRYIGFVDGERKLIVNRTTGARELYDLARDPLEVDNIIDEVPADVAETWVAELAAVAEAQEAALRAAPRLPEVDIQAEVLKRARVFAKATGEDWKQCKRRQAEQAFACVDGRSGVVAPRARTRTMSGRARDCVLMDVPADGGKLELKLTGAPFFSLLSRVRVALLEGAAADDSVLVTVQVDGEQRNSRRVDREHPERRVSHGVPTQKLRLTLSASKPLSKPLCVTFTDKAWRP